MQSPVELSPSDRQWFKNNAKRTIDLYSRLQEQGLATDVDIESLKSEYAATQGQPSKQFLEEFERRFLTDYIEQLTDSDRWPTKNKLEKWAQMCFFGGALLLLIFAIVLPHFGKGAPHEKRVEKI